MARTRHLPLYAATYGFAKETFRIKVKLPKLLKYDLGQEAFTSAIKMLHTIDTGVGNITVIDLRNYILRLKNKNTVFQRNAFTWALPKPLHSRADSP